MTHGFVITFQVTRYETPLRRCGNLMYSWTYEIASVVSLPRNDTKGIIQRFRKNDLFSYQLFLFSAIKITPPAKRILRMAYFEYLRENRPEIILKEYLQDHDSSVNV